VDINEMFKDYNTIISEADREMIEKMPQGIFGGGCCFPQIDV